MSSMGAPDGCALAVDATVQKAPSYRQYFGVMTGWDNTARRGNHGHVFAYSTSKDYELWLRAVVGSTEAMHPPSERFVFINAWNEWAEGAHLEPDIKSGRAYLEATRRALTRRSEWRAVIDAVRADPDLNASILRSYITDLEFALEAYDRSLSYISRVSDVLRRIEDALGRLKRHNV